MDKCLDLTGRVMSPPPGNRERRYSDIMSGGHKVPVSELRGGVKVVRVEAPPTHDNSLLCRVVARFKTFEERSKMEVFVNRYATPLTIRLFSVSAISGSALFFHWLPGTFSRHTPQPMDIFPTREFAE